MTIIMQKLNVKNRVGVAIAARSLVAEGSSVSSNAGSWLN
jgi:hypothetical protein